MDGSWKTLGNDQVDICILTSQGGALFADLSHVFMTFGMSLKAFTIWLELNGCMAKNICKTSTSESPVDSLH